MTTRQKAAAGAGATVRPVRSIHDQLGLDVLAVDELPWLDATAAELAFTRSLLPSRVLERALAEAADEVARLFRGLTTAAPPAELAPIMPAFKSPQGFRPIHVLTLHQRVLYRALVMAIDPPIPTPDRSNEAYERFESEPGATDAEFVVRADISSFYQYIDHEMLQRMIILMTGDALHAGAVADLLGAIVGRGFGLPQSNSTSDQLAEVVLGAIERRLARMGHRVWRYSDDFRFTASNRAAAHTVLADFEGVLRGFGLTPNEEKCLVVHRTAYIDRMAERIERIEANVPDRDIDVTSWLQETFGEYDDEIAVAVQHVAPARSVDDSDDDEEELERRQAVESAEAAMAIWHDDVTEGPRDPLDVYVTRRLLLQSLRTLRAGQSPSALRMCVRMIDEEPQLTHTIAGYMGALVRTAEEQVIDALLQMLHKSGEQFTPWQSLWLLEPSWRLSNPPQEVVRWVQALVQNGTHNSILRARAAFALARFASITSEEIGRLIESSSGAARPDLIAAYATIDSEGALNKASDSRLDRLIAEWVSQR